MEYKKGAVFFTAPFIYLLFFYFLILLKISLLR